MCVAVGGGSAGSVMAARLAEVAEWKVLLLEAGGQQPPESLVPALNVALFQSDVDWNFRSTPQKYSLKAFKNNVRSYFALKIIQTWCIYISIPIN